MISYAGKLEFSPHTNSVAFDESTDKTDTAQIAIFIRGMGQR